MLEQHWAETRHIRKRRTFLRHLFWRDWLDVYKRQDEESKEKYAREFLTKEYTERYAQQEQEKLQQLSTEELAAALDAMPLTTQRAAELFSRTLSSSTYQENLEALGYVQQDAPDGINFYATSFENKDALADLIQEYNEKNADDESKQITLSLIHI